MELPGANELIVFGDEIFRISILIMIINDVAWMIMDRHLLTKDFPGKNLLS